MVPKAKPRTHACSALAAPGNPPEPYAWALYRWNVERPRCLPLMADTDVALRNAIQYQPSTYLGRPDWWASGRLVLDNQTAETLNTVVREHQKISQGTVGVAKVVADLMLGAGVMLLGKGGRSAHGRPVDYEANLWAAHAPVRVLDRHYDANGPSPAPNARAGPPARSEPPATPQSRRPPRTHLQTHQGAGHGQHRGRYWSYATRPSSSSAGCARSSRRFTAPNDALRLSSQSVLGWPPNGDDHLSAFLCPKTVSEEPDVQQDSAMNAPVADSSRPRVREVPGQNFVRARICVCRSSSPT